MKLIAQKVEGWGYRSWKLHDPNFNRFCMNHPCDGQTDRQTDGITIAYAHLAIAYMLSRARTLYKHTYRRCEQVIRKRWLKSVRSSFRLNEASDDAALSAGGRQSHVRPCSRHAWKIYRSQTKLIPPRCLGHDIFGARFPLASATDVIASVVSNDDSVELTRPSH